MKKVLLISLLAIASFVLVIKASSANPSTQKCNCPFWIDKTLEKIETVKVGMTRKDLLKVFGTEGGISNRTQRTYVYRESTNIKVDVKFEAVENKNDEFEEYPTDKIIEISKPYLARMIVD